MIMQNLFLFSIFLLGDMLIHPTIQRINASPLYHSSNIRHSYLPIFQRKLLQENLSDGYWIDAFRPDSQSLPELISYGLSTGTIYLHRNVSDSHHYNVVAIQKFDGPVAMDQADINEDGLNDIILCFQYGRTMLDTDPDGGRIVWLENPGLNIEKNFWKVRYIGRLQAMHRLKVGRFTQNEKIEIIGLPIVGTGQELLSPVSVVLFRQPENVLNATQWVPELIDNTNFRIVHDAYIVKMNGFDSLLVASQEGINWLYFSNHTRTWNIEHIGDGDQSQREQIVFAGTGGIAAGRIAQDSFGYIAAVEPFHGNTVAVYVKNNSNSLKTIQWTRFVLDTYGYANEQGEGPIHYVVTADLDNDGIDEFLVALRGPQPYEGVYLYKIRDLNSGLFSKWKISDTSAGRIAVEDFDRDGLLDFATISYAVPGYYLANEPSVILFLNRLAEFQPKNNTLIEVERQGSDLLFTVPELNEITQFHSIPFLKINGIELLVEIIPPLSSRYIEKDTYIKVLSGRIGWSDSLSLSNQGLNRTRTPFPPARQIETLEIRSDNSRIRTFETGAVLFTLKKSVSILQPIHDIDNLEIINILPGHYGLNAQELKFRFIRYDQIDARPQFKDLEFYNFKGFDIRFRQTNERLTYVQFWAAGLDVNAGVHNHKSDTFCEIHVCLSNGSGNGGMHFLNSSKDEYNPATTKDSDFNILPMPVFSEHGPLWDIDSQGKPIMREDSTIVYPWHKWQAGSNSSLNQSYDVWLVFEFSSKFSQIPAQS